MAISVTGKIEGTLSISGTAEKGLGSQKGTASIKVTPSIKANYNDSSLTDFTIYNTASTLTGTVDSQGILYDGNGVNGVTYTITNKSKTDSKTGITFTINGSWKITATNSTVTVTKQSFTVTTSAT